MIRQAWFTDVPEITSMMLAMKSASSWKEHYKDGFTVQAVSDFLKQQLVNPDSMCYVWDVAGVAVAFCGVRWATLVQPPHVPLVCEWGWYGRPRDAAKCWRACADWGKRRGAGFGMRVTAVSSNDMRRVVEQVTWEVL